MYNEIKGLIEHLKLEKESKGKIADKCKECNNHNQAAFHNGQYFAIGAIIKDLERIIMRNTCPYSNVGWCKTIGGCFTCEHFGVNSEELEEKRIDNGGRK